MLLTTALLIFTYNSDFQGSLHHSLQIDLAGVDTAVELEEDEELFLFFPEQRE